MSADFPDFHVITGGPGAGKTSIIEVLARRGFATVAESGRAILREQAAIGGRATHRDDPEAFRDLMLARGIADHEAMRAESSPVFFDRGVVELVGYCALIGVPVPEPVRRAAELYRYAPRVFVAPPWKEIYRQDGERGQDWDEAVRTHDLLRRSWEQFGYDIVEIPRAPVSERVAFVLRHVD